MSLSMGGCTFQLSKHGTRQQSTAVVTNASAGRKRWLPHLSATSLRTLSAFISRPLIGVHVGVPLAADVFDDCHQIRWRFPCLPRRRGFEVDAHVVGEDCFPPHSFPEKQLGVRGRDVCLLPTSKNRGRVAPVSPWGCCERSLVRVAWLPPEVLHVWISPTMVSICSSADCQLSDPPSRAARARHHAVVVWEV